MYRLNEDVYEKEWEDRANAEAVAELRCDDLRSAVVRAMQERHAAEAREAKAYAHWEQMQTEYLRLESSRRQLEQAADLLRNASTTPGLVEDLLRGAFCADSIDYLKRPRLQLLRYDSESEKWVLTEWGKGTQRALHLLLEKEK